MDIILKQILIQSHRDEMFKEGAIYLKKIYCNENRELM